MEDDEIDIISIKLAFAQRKMADRLQFAKDGQAALELLNGIRPPDSLPRALFLDQNMPRMSGLELLEKLREVPRLKAIPVIMMTTSRTMTEKRWAEDLGVVAYFVKEDLMPDYAGLFNFIDRM